MKPFSARELLARVAGHLELARVRRRARERLELLAGAGAILSGSLDVPAMLGRLARLLAGKLGEVCLIDVIDPDLTLKGLAILHAEVTGGERLELGLS